MYDFSHLISKSYFRCDSNGDVFYILDDILESKYCCKTLGKLYPKVSQRFIDDHVKVLKSYKQDNYFYRVIGHHFFNRIRESYYQMIKGVTDKRKTITKISVDPPGRGGVNILTKFELYEENRSDSSDSSLGVLSYPPDRLRSVMNLLNTSRCECGFSTLFDQNTRKNILWCRIEQNHTSLVMNRQSVPRHAPTSDLVTLITYDKFLAITSKDRYVTSTSDQRWLVDKEKLRTYISAGSSFGTSSYNNSVKYAVFDREDDVKLFPEEILTAKTADARLTHRECPYTMAPHSLYNTLQSQMNASYHVYNPQIKFSFDVRSLVETTTLCRALSVFQDRFSGTRIMDNGDIVAFAYDPETNDFAVEFVNGKIYFTTMNYDYNARCGSVVRPVIKTYPLPTADEINGARLKQAFSQQLKNCNISRYCVRVSSRSISVILGNRSKFIIEIARDRLFVVYEIDVEDQDALYLRESLVRAHEISTEAIVTAKNMAEKKGRRQRSTRNIKDRDIKVTLYAMMHGIHHTNLLNLARHAYIPTMLCDRDMPFFNALHKSLNNMKEFQRRIRLEYKAVCAYSTQPCLVSINVTGRKILSCAATTKIQEVETPIAVNSKKDRAYSATDVHVKYKFTKKSLHKRKTTYSLGEQAESIKRYLNMDNPLTYKLSGTVEEFIDYDLTRLLYTNRDRRVAFVVIRWDSESTQYDIVSSGRLNPVWNRNFSGSGTQSSYKDIVREYDSFQVLFLENSAELSVIQRTINMMREKQLINACDDGTADRCIAKHPELEHSDRDTGHKERVRFLESEEVTFPMNTEVARLLSIANNRVNEFQVVFRQPRTKFRESSFLRHYGIASCQAIDICEGIDSNIERGIYTLYYYVCSLNSRFWGLGLLFYETGHLSNIPEVDFHMCETPYTIVIHGSVMCNGASKSFTYVYTCNLDMWMDMVQLDRNCEFALIYNDNPIIINVAKYCSSIARLFEDPRTPFYNLATLFADFCMDQCFSSQSEECKTLVHWATISRALCLDMHTEYEFDTDCWTTARKIRCNNLTILLTVRFLLVHCSRGKVCKRTYSEESNTYARRAMFSLTTRYLDAAMKYNIYRELEWHLNEGTMLDTLTSVSFNAVDFSEHVYKFIFNGTETCLRSAKLRKIEEFDHTIFKLMLKRATSKVFVELAAARTYSTFVEWFKRGVCNPEKSHASNQPVVGGWTYQLTNVMRYVERIIKPHYSCTEVVIKRSCETMELPLIIERQENVDKIYRNGFAWTYERETRNKIKPNKTAVRSRRFPNIIMNIEHV